MRVMVIFDCVMKRGRHLWISASVDSYSITALAEIQDNDCLSRTYSLQTYTSCDSWDLKSQNNV